MMDTPDIHAGQNDEHAYAARQVFALDDSELDGVVGGIALLLPAVQAAREVARRNYGTLAKTD